MADEQSENEEIVLRLRNAYRSVFNSEHGPTVLKDLAAFTGDDLDLFDPDAGITAYRLGMRRVLLRIRAMQKE